MKGVCVSIIGFFYILVSSLLLESNAAPPEGDHGVYIVYMGAATASTNGAPRNDHLHLLSSLMRRDKDAVVHNYSNGFSGFSARLSKNEAISIAQRPGVVSVFPDPILKLHTTHSWDFLKYQNDIEIDSHQSQLLNGEDAIVGILDTGIWPESESFSDKDIGAVPSRWKGKCMEGKNFSISNCNRKLIGARFYDIPDPPIKEIGTPRDKNGHGTHVASTIAGSPVSGASYYGLATGTAKGGSPGSRIAMYRVCTLNGCRGSVILKAFDDAIGDGVDVISLSLGATEGTEPVFNRDPIAIGSFHAVEKGIIVVCSAGNDGPDTKSVVNVAPWILTVAATTIDRDFQVDILLGNRTIKGGGVNFGKIQKSPIYPLVYGSSVKSDTGSDDEFDARNCNPGSLDENKVKGKIIVCENTDKDYLTKEKQGMVMNQGGVGIIMIDDDMRTVAPSYGSFPFAIVTSKDGAEILSYINSRSNPMATILPTVTVTNYKPAPIIAYFSSRGPSYMAKNILKPDIAAPGVNILAAWPGNKKGDLADKEPPLFNLLSGTSMACPHVSGVAATVKSQNPLWSPSAIKSAIMTTAIQTNNVKTRIATNSGTLATPFDIGAGEVSTIGSLDPGLVYETEIVEYLQFLCNSGYGTSTIKLISSAIPNGFSCSNTTSEDLISSMNYPSIAISDLQAYKSKKVKRIVTNVGEDNSTYTVTVDTPTGLQVEVTPSKLQFTKRNQKLSYEVTFTPNFSPKEDMFGSITWTTNKYKVRSPFVINGS